MAKFVVDRRTWYRGKGPDDSKLLTGNGMRCCIGFVGQQIGCDDGDLMGAAEVIVIASKRAINNFPLWMRDSYSKVGMDGFTLIGQAYHTNDDENLTDEQRETLLKELFTEAGDEIEFIN